MSSKKKHVVLSMRDKITIIERLDKGVSGKTLAETYGVELLPFQTLRKIGHPL